MCIEARQLWMWGLCLLPEQRSLVLCARPAPPCHLARLAAHLASEWNLPVTERRGRRRSCNVWRELAIRRRSCEAWAPIPMAMPGAKETPGHSMRRAATPSGNWHRRPLTSHQRELVVLQQEHSQAVFECDLLVCGQRQGRQRREGRRHRRQRQGVGCLLRRYSLLLLQLGCH